MDWFDFLAVQGTLKSLLQHHSSRASILGCSAFFMVQLSFSSCPQSFPASGSFLMSRLFTSGGQTIGASVSASILPVNTQGCFSLGLSSQKTGRTTCSSCDCVFWDYILEARIKQEQQKERNSVVFFNIIYLIFNFVFFLSGVTPFLHHPTRGTPFQMTCSLEEKLWPT